MLIEPFLVILLALAALSDFISRRIPNLLIVGGLTSALMLQIFLPSGGLAVWLLGMLTGLGIFLPFYALRGMAAGDVKLMAVVGSFVGPFLAFKIAIATFLIGGIWSLVVIILRGRIRDTLINLRALLMPILMRAAGAPTQTGVMPKESVGRIPYGVSIALGTISVLLLERMQ